MCKSLMSTLSNLAANGLGSDTGHRLRYFTLILCACALTYIWPQINLIWGNVPVQSARLVDCNVRER